MRLLSEYLGLALLVVPEQAFTVESNTVTPDQRERDQVNAALWLPVSSLHCVARVNGEARRLKKKNKTKKTPEIVCVLTLL